MSRNFLNRHVTLQLYELTPRSYAKHSVYSRTLNWTGRVFLLELVPGTGARATILDLLASVHDFDAGSLVESLHQGRPTRLGLHHPDL